jgi:glucose/arabinose dehydrogenase
LIKKLNIACSSFVVSCGLLAPCSMSLFFLFATAQTCKAETAPAEAVPAETVPPQPQVSLVKVLGGLDKPVAFDFVPGRTKTFGVLESAGKVKIVHKDQAEETELLLDLSEVSKEFVQREFLDLVLHPEFQKNGRYFLSSTAKGSYGSDIVISEFKRKGSPAAEEVPEKEIIRLRQPFPNRRRVPLVFDNSGMLLIGLSDGGGDYDPKDNGQNRASLFGSITRIDVDQKKAYIPPLDNPFVLNDGGAREIFAYGFRYPASIVVDPRTGEIYASDRGMNTFEEINHVKSGANYGWAIFEGSLCLRMQLECRNSRVSAPLIKYPRKFGQEAFLAGVVRRQVESRWNGYLVFADIKTTELWAFPTGRQKPEAEKLLKSQRKISDFAVDATGHLYLSDVSSGEIFLVEIK